MDWKDVKRIQANVNSLNGYLTLSKRHQLCLELFVRLRKLPRELLSRNIENSIIECVTNETNLITVKVVVYSLHIYRFIMLGRYKRKETIPNIPSYYLKLAFDDNISIRSLVYDVIVEDLVYVVQNNMRDTEVILSSVKEAEERSIVQMFTKVLSKVDQSVQSNFVHKLIAKVCKVGAPVNLHVELGMELSLIISYDLLSTKAQIEFRENLKNEYIVRIEEWESLNLEIWSKAWIFLFRYSKSLFHRQVAIKNLLLKVVEKAFKSNNLLAFDCWKEVIDDYLLGSPERLHIEKHRTLILIPLIKNNHKLDFNYTKKRCDLFTYLLSKLKQEHTHYLIKYVHFAFGPVTQRPLNSLDQSKVVPIRIQPLLLEKVTRVFLHILGHFDHEGECLNTDEYSNIAFKITFDMFKQLYHFFINVAAECSLLMLQWSKKEKIPQMVKCIWGTVFANISKLNDRGRQDALTKVLELFIRFMEASKILPLCREYVFTPIVEMFASCSDVSLPEEIIFPMLKNIQKESCDNLEYQSIMSHLIASGKFMNHGVYFEATWNFFVECKITNNITQEMWIQFADFFTKSFQEDHFTGTDFEQVTNFLIWPILNYSSEELFMGRYKKIITQALNSSDKFRFSFIGNIKNILNIKTDSNQIDKFLVVISEICAFLDSEEDILVLDILKLLENILSHQDISQGVIEAITFSMIKYFDVVHSPPFSKCCEQMLEKTICCCHHLISIHKNLEVLSSLKTFTKTTLVQEFKKNIPNEFVSLIMKLKVIGVKKEHRDEILKHLDTGKDSAAAHTPKSNSQSNQFEANNNVTVSTPTRTSATLPKTLSFEPEEAKLTGTIRLFGQEVETSTPKKLKGSPLNADISHSSKKKGIANAMPKFKTPKSIDDVKGEFVAVSSTVKVNMDKLSDHQLETLKRRREDIPALYQDLSQSNSSSQSLFKKLQNDTSSSSECKLKNSLQNQADSSKDVQLENQGLKKSIRRNSKTESTEKPQPDISADSNMIFGSTVKAHAKRTYKRKAEQVLNNDTNVKVPKLDGELPIAAEKNASEKTPILERRSKRKRKPSQFTSGEFVLTEATKSKKKSTDESNCVQIVNPKETSAKKVSLKSNQLPIKHNLRSSLHKNTKDDCNEASTVIEKSQVVKSDLEMGTKTDSSNTTENSEDIIESSQESLIDIKHFSTDLPSSLTINEKEAAASLTDSEKTLTPFDTQSVVLEGTGESPILTDSEKVITSMDTFSPIQESEIVNKQLTGSEKITAQLHTQSLDNVINSEVVNKIITRLDTQSPTLAETFQLSELNTDTENSFDDPFILKAITSSSEDNSNLEQSAQLAEHLKVTENLPENVDDCDITMENPSLLGSPVTADTPVKTLELLDSTNNISPIKPDGKQLRTCVNGDFGCQESELLHNELTDTDIPKVVPKDLFKVPQTRAERLLSLVPSSKTMPKSPKSIIIDKVFKKNKTITTVSPKTNRIKKMMERCEENQKHELAGGESSQVYYSFQSIKKDSSKPNLPLCGILKKADRMTEQNKAKVKRVNFSHPLITVKIIFTSDAPISPPKNENFSDVNAASQPSKMCLNDDFLSTNSPVNPTQVSTELIEGESAPDVFDSLDTQGFIDTTVQPVLDDDKPIFSALINSTLDIADVVEKLSTPMFVSNLLLQLKEKGICTIGDLAKLSELEINRLPLKMPKVQNVKEILSALDAAECSSRNNVGNFVSPTLFDTEDVLEKDKMNEENLIHEVLERDKTILNYAATHTKNLSSDGTSTVSQEIVLESENAGQDLNNPPIHLTDINSGINNVTSTDGPNEIEQAVINIDSVSGSLNHQNCLNAEQDNNENLDIKNVVGKIVRDGKLSKLIEILSENEEVNVKEVIKMLIDKI